MVIAPDAGMVHSASPRTQQEHLDDLVRRYTARTAASRQLAQRHRHRLADSRAVVGFRRSTKEMLYPVAARRAEGARIEDIDGNSYTDITMGFGVLLFGHEPGFVREAVREHLSRGIRLGPRSVETGAAAELLCELTGMERVAFANSGTEANAAAIRLARAATGRDRIVTFQGAYHGHADQVLGRRGGPRRPGGDRARLPGHPAQCRRRTDRPRIRQREGPSRDRTGRGADRGGHRRTGAEQASSLQLLPRSSASCVS